MKKKAFAFALTASLLLCPLTASAEEDAALDPGYVDPENEDAAAPANGDDLFEVEYTNDGYCKIKKFKPGASYSGPVDIPSKVGDYFVIDICSGAFMECSGVTSVSLPDDITDIGDNVFLGCTALESFSVAPGRAPDIAGLRVFQSSVPAPTCLSALKESGPPASGKPQAGQNLLSCLISFPQFAHFIKLTI